MAVLHEAGLQYARKLIEDGLFSTDAGWDFTQEDSARLAEIADDDTYNQFFLGEEGEEKRQVYPFARAGEDGVRVHLAALSVIHDRAQEREEEDIAEAAQALMREIELADSGAGADGEGDGGDGDGGDGGGGDGKPTGIHPSRGRSSGPARVRARQKEENLLSAIRKRQAGGEFLERTMAVDRQVDRKKREVTLVASTSAEVRMWFGVEILSHENGAVLLDRINGRGPLMSEHWGEQIGVSEEVWLENSERMRARVRFSKKRKAQEEFDDVLDDIRTCVSIRYLVHSVKLVEEREDGTDVYLVDKWEPTHIALVAEPADLEAGTDRSQGGAVARHAQRGENMSTENKQGEFSPEDRQKALDEIRKAENERAGKIRGATDLLANKYPDIAEKLRAVETKAIQEGWDEARHKAELVTIMGERNEAPTPNPNDSAIGLSAKETRQWSWARAVRALLAMEGRGPREDIEAAGFEREVSNAVKAHMGIANVRGFLLPYEKMMSQKVQRAMNIATSTAGGSFKETELRGLIDALIEDAVVLPQVTRFEGLNGDVTFPTWSEVDAAYHLANETTDLSAESSITTGLVTLAPKELGAYIDITRKMQKQSDVVIDQFVEMAISSKLQLTMEQKFFKGGGTGEPDGILDTSGIGDVSAPATPSTDSLFGMMVDLKTALRNAKGHKGALRFITNPDVQGLLEQSEKQSGNGQYIYVETESGGRVAGRPCDVTTLCPNNLGGTTDESAIVYGNMLDAFLGLWGTLDFTLDRSSLAKQGGLRVVGFIDYDWDFGHPGSFAAVTDLDVGNDY